VCLGEYATIVEVIDVGRAVVRFDDDSIRQVSLAVLVADGTTVSPGDRVMVSIGLALEHEPQSPHQHGPRAANPETSPETVPETRKVAR
jgi:hypothetical protein